ncbi:MAG: PqiC family protein [Deferrisomatales bacterium]|nr:PqiC family protein [Deferrisomatales bacterium]
MRPAPCRRPRIAVLLAVLVTSGCLGKGTVEPTRHFLLEALPAPVAAGVDGPSIGVGPVSLPEYADRPQLVTRAGDNEIEVAAFARWAAPLREQVARTLAENLSALLGVDRVAVFPWWEPDGVDYRVVVDIHRFEADAAGNALLAARWRLHRKGRVEPVASGRSEYAAPAGAKGHGAFAAAQSRSLQGLSGEIAAAIREEAPGGPGGNP